MLVLHAVNVGNCLIKGGARHCACHLQVLHDFFVEDGEIQGESQPQGVRIVQEFLCLSFCVLVRQLCFVCSRTALVFRGKLCHVPQEVCLHFDQEDFDLVSASVVRNQVVFYQVEYFFTLFRQLCLNLSLVALNFLNVCVVTLDILFLLNLLDCSPGSSPLTNHILVRRCQEVAFV